MPRATRQRATGVTVAIGSLVLVLAAAPFLPRGGGDQDAVRPAAADHPALPAHATAGQSAVTEAAEAEIDRVVNQGLTASLATSGSRTATPTTETLVAAQIRCADFEGQRYCLHQGWTDDAPSEVVANVTAQATQASSLRSTAQASGTGDADILTTLQASARRSPDARAAAERAELTKAAKAVAKVWLIRNQIEGVPLPPGFLDRHPEIRTEATDTDNHEAAKPTVNAPSVPTPRSSASSSPTPSAPQTTKTWKDYPQRAKVLSKHEVAEQTRTYYCGPTSMMIAWGWSGKPKSQEHWASRLGTTSSGSAISEMVRVTNEDTGWDGKAYAGPYIVLDIGDWTYGKWWLNMRHVFDYRAPLILDPILLKQFYPYLDDDASGHFQVGRGYRKNGNKMNLIGFFEPWNQQRFDPSEPYISRVQWRSAYRSYRGNQAHSMHNIGV